MMKHETNTFSPIRTDWRRFVDWGAYFGAEARRAYEGTGDADRRLSRARARGRRRGGDARRRRGDAERARRAASLRDAW